MTLAVQVRNARRTFTAELAPVRALRGVDVDVDDGEFVAVTGPSGCGKSTLLNVIAGLDRVDEGSVEVAGQQIDGRDEDWLARFRRHHIGIVFQFFNLLDGVSALDNIVLPAVLGGMRRRAAETRARDLLDLLGLGDRSAQVPAVLSGWNYRRLYCSPTMELRYSRCWTPLPCKTGVGFSSAIAASPEEGGQGEATMRAPLHPR